MEKSGNCCWRGLKADVCFLFEPVKAGGVGDRGAGVVPADHQHVVCAVGFFDDYDDVGIFKVKADEEYRISLRIICSGRSDGV